MDRDEILKALAHPTRLEILDWLKQPEKHFAGQEHPLELGVCAGQFERCGLSQSTVSAHLGTLHRAGLVSTKRLGQWIFYKRNEAVIAEFLSCLHKDLFEMPLALFILALSSFAIGTTEFVVLGLLPDVAGDLGVTIPQAGWLVTGYALAVAIGAPIMAISTAHLRRRSALILLMAVFILGNLLCAIAPNYWVLMIARIVTALCHGAFFGIGSVAAANLVSADRRARAVALMFTGLTLANVLGVPLGTAFGQAYGWRAPFWAVVILGAVSLVGLMLVMPKSETAPKSNILSEISALRGAGLWLSLAMTMFFSAAMFALFTYIAPILRDVTGVSPQGVTWTLFLIGLGLTVGNLLGGRLADWRLGTSLAGIFGAIALTSAIFSFSSQALIPAEITLFIWALATFAAVPALQIGVVRYGKNAPNLVSTINIGAFNLGNALGAWVGGTVIDNGFSLSQVPLAAAVLALIGLGVVALTFATPRARRDALAAAE